MVRFFADENFPFPVAEALRRLGHEVLIFSESGKAGQKVPDDEVLKIAHAEKRVLLTLNRKHFIRLHNEKLDHSGIIVCTFDPDFVGQAGRIHTAIQDQQNMANILIRVNRLAE